MGNDVKVESGSFHEEALEALAYLLAATSVEAAVIHNESGCDVTFEVYDYTDTVYWMAAEKTFCAKGHQTAVTASGKRFKIHPNGNKFHEFLVEPGRAYVYRGFGRAELVD